MRPLKLLVIDDSRAMRSIIRRVLRQAGYGQHEVLEAADGRSALDMIKAERPHLIIADWNMPVMNGMDLLKVIRRAGLEIPFGFLTAQGTTEMRELATENGADFFVSKPFNAKDIKLALSRYLG